MTIIKWDSVIKNDHVITHAQIMGNGLHIVTLNESVDQYVYQK
jgi:hypothetical protein